MVHNQIISSQLDSDKLDNLLRNSLMAGINYGKIDINVIGRVSSILAAFLSSGRYYNPNRIILLDISILWRQV
ncbi:MAG: hypothetical protein ACE5R6_02000 [Candidatus Heimdallarchaeota archaeon]